MILGVDSARGARGGPSSNRPACESLRIGILEKEYGNDDCEEGVTFGFWYRLLLRWSGPVTLSSVPVSRLHQRAICDYIHVMGSKE